jgi:hypothetical protein
MRIYLAVAALATLASTPGVQAADIDPDACFCLRHSSGQSQRGCRAEKFPGQFYQSALCADPETRQTAEILLGPASPWAVVREGAAGCEVCRAESRGTADVPRQDADHEEAAD